LEQVDKVLDRNNLSQRERTMARAFAKAVYRRAVAKVARSSVEATVSDALDWARSALNRSGSQRVKRSVYAYESGSASSTRTHRKRESKHGSIDAT
jgi:hypothetical protein